MKENTYISFWNLGKFQRRSRAASLHEHELSIGGKAVLDQLAAYLIINMAPSWIK